MVSHFLYTAKLSFKCGAKLGKQEKTGLLGYFLLLLLPCVVCLHEAEKVQVSPAKCKHFICIRSLRTYLFITNKYMRQPLKIFSFFVFSSLVECNGQKGARKIIINMYLLPFSTRMNIINMSVLSPSLALY